MTAQRTEPVIPSTATDGGTPVFQLPVTYGGGGYFDLKIFSSGAGENSCIVLMPKVPGESTIVNAGNSGTVITEGTIDPEAVIMADNADFTEILADDSTPPALDTESNFTAYMFTFTGANATASIKYRMKR